jgi:hypothetical protein
MDTTTYVETAPTDSGLLGEMTGGGFSDQLAELGVAPLLPQQPLENEMGFLSRLLCSITFFLGDFTEPWLTGLRHPSSQFSTFPQPAAGLGLGMV